MCDIFIMCFVLLLFVTCSGWNFNDIADAAAAAALGNSEKIWKIQRKSMLNSEKIWKIQKKIVKRYVKYGRKVG
jgi:hypothetical protein